MQSLFILLWLASVPAFIFFWWKKRKARLAAGKNYSEDENYQSKSKIKRIIGIVSIVSFCLAVLFSPNAEEKAKIEADRQAIQEQKAVENAERERIADEKKATEERLNEQKKESDMTTEITTGWNTETTGINENTFNWEKATDLVKKYPDYVHNAQANWIDVNDAFKRPWEYYGKVVNMNGRIYSIEQLPPGNSVAKFFDGNCYSAMLYLNDNVTASIHIVGNSDKIADNSNINVKDQL